MINFEDEIKKFKPCLEVDEVEESLHDFENKDVTDIINEVIKEIKGEN